MQIKLKRIYKGDSYTIGRLYINNKYFCDTLEDKVRNLKKEPKIYGKTAIPEGEYEIDMNTISPKFKNRNWAKKWGGIVPRLKNVPYFEGVLIHPGNYADYHKFLKKVTLNLNNLLLEESDYIKVI